MRCSARSPPPHRARSWRPCSRSRRPCAGSCVAPPPGPRGTSPSGSPAGSIPLRYVDLHERVLTRDPRVVDEDVESSPSVDSAASTSRTTSSSRPTSTSRRRPTRATPGRRPPLGPRPRRARRRRRGSPPRGTGGRSPSAAAPPKRAPLVGQTAHRATSIGAVARPCDVVTSRRTCAGWWQTWHGPAKGVRHHRGPAA